VAQSQIQQQSQEQKQQQSISAQQVLLSQLVELPLQQMTERIETELHDNPALEKKVNDDELTAWESPEATNTSDDAEDFEMQREREERNDALDEALQNIGRDDEELPVYQGGRQWAEEQEPIVVGEEQTFYDQLMEQVGEMELDDHQRFVVEYIIQSLDDDGLLRTPLDDIREYLAIHNNIDIEIEELEKLLRMVQQMDPPGIGGRSLQECLLLQVERKRNSPVKELMKRMLTDYFDEFTKNHLDRIQQQLELNDMQMKALLAEFRRLNPKPGAAMGESIGRSLQQITPDFIVDTHDDGTISFSLNTGDMPKLEISQSFADLLKDFQNNKDNMTRQQKEALLYTKQKVEAAQNFIGAIETRRRTLTMVMKAIIQLQRPFFKEGDEELLHPMILRDIATLTELDLSTISRVTSSKYVQTRWGTFPLKFFFSDGYVTNSGEELSTRKIKVALRDIIDGEDKRKPLSDEALRNALEQRGYPIARRTVAKYREQLGVPVARLRKS